MINMKYAVRVVINIHQSVCNPFIVPNVRMRKNTELVDSLFFYAYELHLNSNILES